MTAKLKEIRAQLKVRRHESHVKTVKWLQSVVRGYFQYHAIPDNQARLDAFRQEVLRMWLDQLRRRSQRSRWNCERFMERLGHLLPEIRVLHPYPTVRFDAKYPGKNRVREQRSHGSVRGVSSNRHPYRDLLAQVGPLSLLGVGAHYSSFPTLKLFFNFKTFPFDSHSKGSNAHVTLILECAPRCRFMRRKFS